LDGLDEINKGDTIQQSGEEISKSFLKLKEHGKFSRTRAMRLKERDVIVAVDGQLFHESNDILVDTLSEEDVEHWIITIYRDGVLFDVACRGPLGGSFEYCNDVECQSIETTLKAHKFYPKEDYKIYEVLKDIGNTCDMYDTSYNPLAVYATPLWLMQQRMWEPLIAILAVYLITINVNIFLFILAAILISLYFKRGQLILRRSYSMYQDRTVWITIAATNELDAQKTCRDIDPKCKFPHSLVGPPQQNQIIKKKRKRSGNLNVSM
jgi:hypothetical protein